MSHLSLTSPRVVQEILARYGLRPNKQLGQNFLIDENILHKIIAAAELGPEDTVLEIGPGIGVLTGPLAERAWRVIAVEVDKGLIPVLQNNLAPYSNIKIIWGDILKVAPEELLADATLPLKVVANLPYYITSPVIMELLTGPLPLERLVVMVQREVARRLAAAPGSKDYGILSVAVQYYTFPELITLVPRTVFYPRPDVDSAVVRLKMRTSPAVPVGDEALFFRIIRGAFGQRRKTLLNSLGGEFGAEYTREELARFLRAGGIEATRRGETLTLEEFAVLARIITNEGRENTDARAKELSKEAKKG
jgi:16S rRNA (adenine1518-N6/adenine1519-N6)-dimethyltransferase